jgi:acyl carrier protein
MEEELRKIIARVAETTNVNFSADADLRDELDVDSHRAVELVFEIERTFEVTIPTARFDELRTLKTTVALISSLKGGS